VLPRAARGGWGIGVGRSSHVIEEVVVVVERQDGQPASGSAHGRAKQAHSGSETRADWGGRRRGRTAGALAGTGEAAGGAVAAGTEVVTGGGGGVWRCGQLGRPPRSPNTDH